MSCCRKYGTQLKYFLWALPDEPQISLIKLWSFFWFVSLPSAGLLSPQKLSSLFWCLFWFVGLPLAGLLTPHSSKTLVSFGISFGLTCLWQASSLLKNSLVSFCVSFGLRQASSLLKNSLVFFLCLLWFVGLPSAGLLPHQKLSSLFLCLFWFVGLPSAGLLPP